MATKPFNRGEIVRQLEVELMEDFGETAAAILRNVIFASPVGDPKTWQGPPPPGYVGGHFRRNWIVSIGGFDTTIVEGEDSNGSGTFATGNSKIEGFKRQKAGPNLVIQNNVPYANRIANGWSHQREAGWVDEQIDLAIGIPAGKKDLD